MTGVRPFDGETVLAEDQLRIMYLGLPTKGRLAFDADELALIDSALAEDPADYHLWCARAVMAGDAAEAVACYSRALILRPLSSHTLYNRGRKQLGTGDTLLAASDLAAAVALDPDEPWKWHFLGVALYFLSRFEEAAAAFEEAAGAAERTGEDLLPFEVEWMWNCHMKRGDAAAAAEVLRRVDASTAVMESEATYKRRILLYRGLLTEEEFLDGIDSDDAIEAANQTYGYANHLYYVKSDVASSVAALREAIALAPGGAGWGAKMAALDLPGREKELARCASGTGRDTSIEEKGGSS